MTTYKLNWELSHEPECLARGEIQKLVLPSKFYGSYHFKKTATFLIEFSAKLSPSCTKHNADMSRFNLGWRWNKTYQYMWKIYIVFKAPIVALLSIRDNNLNMVEWIWIYQMENTIYYLRVPKVRICNISS